MAIGFALMGAGIFARAEHLPAIASCELLELKAVYSRSQTSAEALASQAVDTGASSSPVDVYFDDPVKPGHSLADMLARADISAVSVCLPITLQAQAIHRALAAGKHVLSEKPVAESVAAARSLLDSYGRLPTTTTKTPPVWAVAENYRYQESVVVAADKVREMGGTLVSFQLTALRLIRPDFRYLKTAWRRTPSYQGGFLLDGGIHYLAALRAMLAAADGNGNGGQDKEQDQNTIVKVAAVSAQLQERLPPVDTLRAVAVTRGGASGLINMSFGTEFGPSLEIVVTTTEGSVTWKPRSVTVLSRGGSGSGSNRASENYSPVTETLDLEDSPAHPAAAANGVKAEFACFARSIQGGHGSVVDARQSPQEALEDLLLLETLLESGAEGGALRTVA